MQVKNSIIYVLNRNKFKKVKLFQSECIITEENKLPETALVIPSPIPKTNNGGISLKLKWAKAKIKEEIKIPDIVPKSLDKIGSKIPRKIISSNNGAKSDVVKNKIMKEK